MSRAQALRPHWQPIRNSGLTDIIEQEPYRLYSEAFRHLTSGVRAYPS